MLINVVDTVIGIDYTPYSSAGVTYGSATQSYNGTPFVNLELVYCINVADSETELESVNVVVPFLLIADQEMFTLMSSYAPNYILQGSYETI
jgi:hypothetical protein